jgi:tRNA U34 5-methylaminomethyl-2-thiouridine-forming methyltransferase MnmC
MKMREFTTQDGSVTLHSEKYDEYYHSKSGAIEESFEKYAKPCGISELAKKGPLRILDIGFGLGYNAIAAIDLAVESNPGCEIEVISLEKDESIIKEIQNLNPCLKNYFIIKKLEYDPKTKSYLYEDKNIFLRIKIGDARDTIKSLDKKFDAVFLAPFSPIKNPELWTEDFMKEVLKKMKKDAILSTFSYARQVRENLKKAGFVVFDGPIIGRRSPCTLAKIKN